jgi:hypothetical protein
MTSALWFFIGAAAAFIAFTAWIFVSAGDDDDLFGAPEGDPSEDVQDIKFRHRA